MESSDANKKKVTLIGFAPKHESASTDGTKTSEITITVNGVNASRSKCADDERVKLVGFARQPSVSAADVEAGKTTLNGTNRRSKSRTATSERRQKLVDETRDWFSKINEAQSPEEKVTMENSFAQKSEHMKKFFDEARQKFAQCSSELFDKFVQDNQEKFAQMLDPTKETAENTLPRGTRHEKTESYSSQQSSSTTNTSTKTQNGFHARTPSSSSTTFTNSSVPPFDTPSFASTDGNEDFFTKFPCSDLPLGSRRQFMSFPAFPTFPGFPSPTPSPGHSPRLASRGNYQMSSSKSTFEYCGNTNTYKFCNEQMSHSYEQTFDAVSESDDDEDDDAISVPPEPSESDDVSINSTFDESGGTRTLALTNDAKLEKINFILHKIATELLTTERSYVAVLHLIDQVFQFRVDNENRAHHMFPQETITTMFSNIKSIYKLHHDFLLPQLEERLGEWSQKPRIGDIMKNFAPFLKMYTEYVRNFDNAMNTINTCMIKHSRFNNIVLEIQRMSECGHLTLQHHMLCPVQRVPRYELLLKDFLKKLPETSPDRADTEQALHLVSTAANHSNEAMKKIDKFKKLLEIQDLIGGTIDLVSPTRELMREGKIIKISARSGDHQERYLFLFNDLLLLCSQKLISNRVVSGPVYRVRAKLDVDNLQVLEGDNLETANTFYIRNNQKQIELYTQTPQEKLKWVEALFKAVQELSKRKSSLKIGAELLEADLGQRAPTFLKMENNKACMICGSEFSAFKRRHHCRACGKVICHKCSNHKLTLAYDENKVNRVCSTCFPILSQQNQQQQRLSTQSTNNDISPLDRKGVLQVSAKDDCVLNGYLHLKTRGKTWVKRWFSLHSDFVLYSFRDSDDQQAMTSTPLPGLNVALADKSDGFTDRDHVFKLFHKRKMYFFQAVDKQDMDRWVSALDKASRAELST